ncbi:MAG: tol-pal system protein YbgF [Proteobacteria bacterium]|nr:MAG: tol-pal system protein YbgF [Pseudomonadota bacterium]
MLYALRRSLIASGVLAALVIPPVQAVSPDELFEVLQRIESLENEVRFLRGENERLRYDIEDVKNTQKSTFIRIDDRMDDLFRAVNTATSKMSAPASSQLPASPAVVPKKAPQRKSLPQVKAPTPSVVAPVVATKKGAAVTKVESATKKTASADKAVTPVNLSQAVIPGVSRVEQAAYQAALRKIKSHPTAAMTQLRGFLKKHPKSPLAGNAQFLLGEMMYDSRNYQGAIDEFVAVLQGYKASPKAPDAAIKLGLSFYEMKNWVYARRTLEDVVRNYPKTKAATLAQARLKKMKADNLY